MGNRYTIDEFSEQYINSKEKIEKSNEKQCIELENISTPSASNITTDIMTIDNKVLPTTKPNIFNKIITFLFPCIIQN